MATKKMLVSYATRNRSACCPRVSSQAHLAAQNVALEALTCRHKVQLSEPPVPSA